MAHEVPALGYSFDALEPHIDALTMEIHHDRHHATYVAGLNAVLESHADLQAKSLEDLIGDLDRALLAANLRQQSSAKKGAAT